MCRPVLSAADVVGVGVVVDVAVVVVLVLADVVAVSFTVSLAGCAEAMSRAEK
jgi:hypothetical protein